MPLYEYKCNQCGDVLEVLQKFSDQPLSSHEECGGALERLISRSALQFKGTGWYVTDYAKGNSGAKDPKPDGATSEPAKAESTKSESAPAPAPAVPAPAAKSPAT